MSGERFAMRPLLEVQAPHASHSGRLPPHRQHTHTRECKGRPRPPAPRPTCRRRARRLYLDLDVALVILDIVGVDAHAARGVARRDGSGLLLVSARLTAVRQRQ